MFLVSFFFSIMAKWIDLAIVLVLLMETFGEECSKGLSSLKGEQITCRNVTSEFFESQKLNLGRAHCLACESCDISVIKEKTFNFNRRNTISYLVLYQNNIRELMDYAFSKFVILKVLSLRDNVLEILHEKCFSGLKRLIQLDLSNNLITDLPNGLFQELENLDVLNLSHNEINSLSQKVFTGLVNLKYLYINYNNIVELPEYAFRELENLKILYLQNNRILRIHQQAFANLGNLNYLYLNNNSINHLEEYNFRPLSSLIDLQMRNNNLVEIQTSSFNGLKSIRYLYLGENKIKTVAAYGFIGLNSLQRLELIGNNFEYFSLDFFKDMDNLEVLWLDNNQISNFSVSYKAEVQPALSVISLKNNSLSFLNYKLLYNKIPNLKELYINGNSWRCEFLVNMFNFFYNQSVILCASTNCSTEDTEALLESACKSYVLNVTEAVDFGDDFLTDKVNCLCYNYYVILVTFCLCLLSQWTPG